MVALNQDIHVDPGAYIEALAHMQHIGRKRHLDFDNVIVDL